MCAHSCPLSSGVNGSVTLGGWIDAKGKVSWGTEVAQWGPKLILILEMDVKLIFYEGKLENA